MRLYVGRAMLRAPKPGYIYPDWPRNALGGVPAAIEETGAKLKAALA